ncbi:glycosyltransferase [Ponticoccus sp. SC2-23]|uniref:glycosyltransferase family 2 protein n=1 Tax=Alexandriicola marinus TaxID=2081710 RepID=UPI000FDC6919|nr:glycosyltransferase family 2 protein [Alexandriicola marinus]MBM1223000.1 glycosyltransferase [Ponticoccus sp. SC6-9]MBM1227461.1 glycosyltransferase [Ponticoccus sp. SC6-15]MBM1231971.1 glycosyltransferase [Ponticoccus sp. SC6-38]MBM1240990.1 glycosyltransferase [Ponticoccus sp. SC6-49]MBM1245483.1 glycosyltransferase [Ponticoccus sp. SC2-64]MBM1254471.1 glycosyltransferase [Ponticoccus sp. SC6-33]MBM1258998.1 glycosyltransferase [Ponticoccus sp. SC6-60]MBM1263463.1 glycosyltransferase 
MRISIVSPSYNQVRFIERTIDSVAKQKYNNKEHIIVDGLSSDGSQEIIRKAEEDHKHLRSIIEADKGQADAINKGLKACNGDIFAWINTDDCYFDENVFQKVSDAFSKHKDVDIIYGRGWRLNSEGEKIREAWINRDIVTHWDFWKSLGILQPSLFFRKHVFDEIGGLADEFVLQLDYEYWIRMAKAGFKFKFIDEIFSSAIVHNDAKSTRDRLAQLSECIEMIDRHFGDVPNEWFDRLVEFSITNVDQKTMITKHKSEAEVDLARIKASSKFLQFIHRGMSPSPACASCQRRALHNRMCRPRFGRGAAWSITEPHWSVSCVGFCSIVGSPSASRSHGLAP